MKIFYAFLGLFLITAASKNFAEQKSIQWGPGTFEDRCTGCSYNADTDTLTCNCCRDHHDRCHQATYKNASQCESNINNYAGTLHCEADLE